MKICAKCELPSENFSKDSSRRDGLSPWCKECVRLYKNGKYREAVLNHYGRSCACCGESEESFLTIDHIARDGESHRKVVGSGTAFYLWLIKEGFPSGFRVLCWNCNCARAFGRTCPHQKFLRSVA